MLYITLILKYVWEHQALIQTHNSIELYKKVQGWKETRGTNEKKVDSSLEH